jgi:hypothetical protein
MIFLTCRLWYDYGMSFEQMSMEGKENSERIPRAVSPERGVAEGRDLSMIMEAKNWEELDAALDSLGKLEGSRQVVYTAEQLKDLIREARKEPMVITLNRITSAGGLRNKVRDLLEKESREKAAH